MKDYTIINDFLSTFLGAFLAFYFSFRLYKRQKHLENKAYLQYAISVFTQLNSRFYMFKEQVKKRYDESLGLQNQLEISERTNSGANLKIREIGNYMFGAEFKIPINLERLDFIVKREPNLIILIQASH